MSRFTRSILSPKVVFIEEAYKKLIWMSVRDEVKKAHQRCSTKASDLPRAIEKADGSVGEV